MIDIIFNIPYGKGDIEVNIPDRNFFQSLEMQKVKCIKEVYKAVRDSLNAPISSALLGEITKGKKSACIIVFDITRSVPNREILSNILGIIENSGIKKNNTKLLIATGTHRPDTKEELTLMMGKQIVDRYEIINHNCHDEEANRKIGMTKSGFPVKINKNFLDADLKILTGTIEQHVWAGFGGGCKGICPGIASFDTIMSTHNPAMLDDDTIGCGILEGNKFYETIIEITDMVKPDFMCNAVLDKYKNPICFFSGHPVKAHKEGCRFCSDLITLNYDDYSDIVIAGSGGYPLDLTLYQIVKAMIQSRKIVREGGTIIIVGECSEGIGNKQFRDQLFMHQDMDLFIEEIYKENYREIDQWQVQELVKTIKRAKVLVYSPKMCDKDFPSHALTRIDSIDEGIKIGLERTGSDSKISVLKDAPFVIPEVKGK